MRLAACATVVLLVVQQSAVRTVWDGVYTAEQTKRGQTVYGTECAVCHGAMLDGVDAAPALTGGTFRSRWDGTNLGDMVERIRTSMPFNNPGTLSRAQVADVLAYVLSVNGMPAGNMELPREAGPLRQIVFAAQKP